MNEKVMNDYLEVVRRNLKYLTLSEKTDIINEIKSHIQEAQMNQGVDINSILQSLGDPTELGKAYAGKTIASITNFNLRNFMRILLYYGATSIGGMVLSVLAGSLYISSFLVILGGVAKTFGTLLGYEMNFIAFKVGNWTIPDILTFPVSIPFAIFLYYCSKGAWKAFKSYLAKASMIYNMN